MTQPNKGGKKKSTPKGGIRKSPPGEVLMQSDMSPSDMESMNTNSLVNDCDGGMDSLLFDWGDGNSMGQDTLARRSEELIRNLEDDDLKYDGDGGMSDAEGDGFDIVTSYLDSMNEANRERNLTEYNEIEDNIAGEEFACVPEITNTIPAPLFGAPKGWLPPTPPATWSRPEAKTDCDEPYFDSVDNPGNWSAFTFKPTFNKKQYVYHCMPAGAVPVPNTLDTGKREVGGYEFFHNG